MKRNFKLISLLTVFTIVLNVLSVLVLLKPAGAMSSVSDTMTRLAVNATGNHVVAFTHAGSSNITITFPATFNLTGAINLTATCSVALQVVTCTNASLTSVSIEGVVNPSSTGQYDILIANTGDAGTASVYIVDSDQVNVTGYINTSIYFDLDTGTDNNDCAYDACLGHGGDVLAYPGNYTVDLGNLTTLLTSESGDDARLHADGLTGEINWVYFDLSTNANAGVVLTYLSSMGELKGPATDNELSIPTVVDGEDLVANTAAYGLSLPVAPTYAHIGSGATATVNADCDSADTFCAVATGTHATPVPRLTTIYSVDGSIDSGRGAIRVGAAIDGTMPPGTYIDTLTFVATATF